MMSELFSDADLISVYSRSDALRDGVLIAIDLHLCHEAGIRLPVAVTDHLWGYIAPDNLDEMPGQSVSGRLWDLLWMFRITAGSPRGRETDRISFPVMFQMKDEKSRPEPVTVTITGVCGPGDDGKPVITLMLPEDD